MSFIEPKNNSLDKILILPDLYTQINLKYVQSQISSRPQGNMYIKERLMIKTTRLQRANNYFCLLSILQSKADSLIFSESVNHLIE